MEGFESNVCCLLLFVPEALVNPAQLYFQMVFRAEQAGCTFELGIFLRVTTLDAEFDFARQDVHVVRPGFYKYIWNGENQLTEPWQFIVFLYPPVTFFEVPVLLDVIIEAHLHN